MTKRSGLGGQADLYAEDDDPAREPETFGIDFVETGVIPEIRRGGGRGWGVHFGYLLGALNLLCLGSLAVAAYRGPPASAALGAKSEWLGGTITVPSVLFALCAVQLVLKAIKIPVIQSGAWQVVFTIALVLYVVVLRGR